MEYYAECARARGIVSPRHRHRRRLLFDFLELISLAKQQQRERIEAKEPSTAVSYPCHSPSCHPGHPRLPACLPALAFGEVIAVMFPFAQNRALNGETANKLLHLLSPAPSPAPCHTGVVEAHSPIPSPSPSQCHCQCIHLKDYKRICRLFAAKWTHLPAAAARGRVGWERAGCGSQ